MAGGMTVAQLLVKLGVDDKDVHEKLDKANTKAKETTGGFKSMLGNALSFAGAAIGVSSVGDAVGFVTGQIKDTIDAAENFQLVQAQTNAVLRSTRDASGQSGEQIDEMARSLANSTMFTHEQTQAAENMLLTFTGIKGNFPQATKLTLDFATAMHMDATNAALQLGKALNDPATGMTKLQREGVTFTEEQKKLIKSYEAHGETAKAQAVILQELQKEFGGSAEAAGKTFPGALAIAGHQLDEVKVTIGQAVLPILAKLLQNLAPIITALANALPGAIATVQKVLGPFFAQVQGALTSGGAMAGFKDLLSDLIPLVMLVANTFTTSILPVLKVLWEQLETNVFPALKRIVDTILKSLAPAILHLVSVIAPVLMPILGVLGWTLGHIVGPAIELIINVVAALIDLLATIIGKIGDFLGLLGHVKDAAGGFGNLLGAIGGRGLPGFASGTDSAPGGLAVVHSGEMILPAYSRVIPAAQVSAFGGFGGGGPGQVIELHSHIYLDGRQIAETVVRHVPSVIRTATGRREF